MIRIRSNFWVRIPISKINGQICDTGFRSSGDFFSENFSQKAACVWTFLTGAYLKVMKDVDLFTIKHQTLWLTYLYRV